MYSWINLHVENISCPLVETRVARVHVNKSFFNVDGCVWRCTSSLCFLLLFS